jgi:hypothetical protein
MLIESDFYSTAAGREHFANQIQSIRVSALLQRTRLGALV